MQPIEKDELFRHLGGFLKAKGIEFKSGAYTDRIQRGCGLLTDVINAGQTGFQRAKAGTEKTLDQLRQVIHEQTAPKPPPPPAAPASPAAPKTRPRSAARKSAKRATASTKSRREKF